MNVKRVYRQPADTDGMRVLVDRVWPRGLTKERAGVKVLTEVAPSPGLCKWLGHDPSRWTEFEARYRAELDDNGAAVARLRELIHHVPVTLLYGAHDEAHNNAVALHGYIDSKRKADGAGYFRSQTSSPIERSPTSAPPNRVAAAMRWKSALA